MFEEFCTLLRGFESTDSLRPQVYWGILGLIRNVYGDRVVKAVSRYFRIDRENWAVGWTGGNVEKAFRRAVKGVIP